jgi:hypothetical protein
MKKFKEHLEVILYSIALAIASMLMIISWLRLFDII